MTIKYEVVVTKTYKVTQEVKATSEKEACRVGELIADYDLNYDGNELTVDINSRAFPQEEAKTFITSYHKTRQDIGDPKIPPHVSVYEVHAEHNIERSDEYEDAPYYQLRYFSRQCRYDTGSTLFYIEEFPYCDEEFARQAAKNWVSGDKLLDLDYALANDGRTMKATNAGNGYGSYGRLR
jgi:hypothetical protein